MHQDGFLSYLEALLVGIFVALALQAAIAAAYSANEITETELRSAAAEVLSSYWVTSVQPSCRTKMSQETAYSTAFSKVSIVRQLEPADGRIFFASPAQAADQFKSVPNPWPDCRISGLRDMAMTPKPYAFRVNLINLLEGVAGQKLWTSLLLVLFFTLQPWNMFLVLRQMSEPARQPVSSRLYGPLSSKPFFRVMALISLAVITLSYGFLAFGLDSDAGTPAGSVIFWLFCITIAWLLSDLLARFEDHPVAETFPASLRDIVVRARWRRSPQYDATVRWIRFDLSLFTVLACSAVYAYFKLGLTLVVLDGTSPNVLAFTTSDFEARCSLMNVEGGVLFVFVLVNFYFFVAGYVRHRGRRAQFAELSDHPTAS